MFIKYFIPEDGDDQSHPNIFRVDSAQPSFATIKDAFPVPGSYHFRFLKNIGSHIVWLDITDESAALPTHQGSIFIKVTRIATVPQSTAASTASVHQAATPFEPTPIFTASSADSTPQVSPPLKAPKPVVDRRPSEKLLKFEDDVTSPASSTTSDVFASTSAPKATAPLLSDDLLGIGSNSADDSSSKNVTAPAASADFFGLDTLKPVSNVMGGGSGNGSRSMSPMGGMGGGGMPAGPMGGMGTKPMSQGSIGSGMNNLGMHSSSPMGGGPAMNPMGGRGGMGMGMGAPQQQAPPPRPMGAGYDPFNSIGGMSGMPPTRGAGGPTTGMNNGRR